MVLYKARADKNAIGRFAFQTPPCKVGQNNMHAMMASLGLRN